MKNHRCLVVTLTTVFTLSGPVLYTTQAQEMPKEYEEVLTFLGKKGDYKDNVLKVNLPRNDLKVTVAGMEIPTSFGFGGWLAMTKGNKGVDVMMGDFVLLEDEVNPVMSALLDNGLEVTALHNHFFWEEPRIFYMHVHGHGKAMDLARRAKPALEFIGHVSPPYEGKSTSEAGKSLPQSAVKIVGGKLDTEKLDQIIGHKGEVSGHVYKVTIGRDDLKLKEKGAVINARMGLNTWAAIVGTDENAAIAGDVAMREGEVNSVLKALRKNGLDVVAIHHHMIEAHPMVIFLHYWGTGPVQKLATGFKAALDELGK
ncbi:MAG: DUF1259 domain-containing protein [Candidatus Latescibacteria bacterium]|nr:DUF1259 domain-containing protein [Candidatus Latescibacterota bacterium]